MKITSSNYSSSMVYSLYFYLLSQIIDDVTITNNCLELISPIENVTMNMLYQLRDMNKIWLIPTCRRNAVYQDL